jgi:hypothetical protein
MQASREEEEEVGLLSNVHSLGKKLVPTTAVTYDDPWPRSKKASSNTFLQLFTANSFIHFLHDQCVKKEGRKDQEKHTHTKGGLCSHSS